MGFVMSGMALNPESEGMPPIKKKLGKKDDPDHELITIRGLVTPVAWDEKGHITAVAVSTFDEDEYLIDKVDKWQQLLSLIRKEVEICGELREESGKKIIRVKKYNIKPHLRSKD